MRLVAPANNRAPREKLTLANGIPITIALQYSTGQRVASRIPGAEDQMMYTLTDGRVAYLPLGVAQMIDELQLDSREPFTICKFGARDWEVQRGVLPQPAPPAPIPPQRSEAARPTATAPRESETFPAIVPAGEPVTRLESALKTAILAASNAEKYGQSIGYTVRFDTDAIKAMAITVLINMECGRK
jgi:hypothetical protein